MSAAATGLAVQEAGAGVPVVLLHSSGLSGRQWRKLVPLLAGRGLRCLVPDLTGHGASPAWPEPAPFSFTSDVAWVSAALEREGPAHLVGHSYGGLLALLAAQARPERVLSLTLFDPVAFGALDPVRDADALATLSARAFRWGPTADDREGWLRSFVDFWGGADAWAALREEARAEFRRTAWVQREGVRTLMEDRTPAEAYRAIRCPVQLITGEASPAAAGRVLRRLAEAMPQARLDVIPGAGHMGPLSHGDAVNALIARALAAA